MLRRLILASLALFLVVVPSASAKDTRIAANVTAGGTDVSGLTLAEAAGKLYNTHSFNTGRPLSTHVAGHKYAVNPADLGFVFDVNKSARRAYNAGLKAHTEVVDVPLFITYDQAQGGRVREQGRGRDQAHPRDARVDIKLRSIGKIESEDGRAIDAKKLSASVGAALADPNKDRILKPSLKVVKPKVTTGGLSKAYGTIVTIDRGNFKLRLFKNLKLSKDLRGRRRHARPTRRPRACSRSPTRPSTRPGRRRTRPGRAPTPTRPCPAARRRTRSRRAGWASSTASASTAPARRGRSGPVLPTGASACAWPT